MHALNIDRANTVLLAVAFLCAYFLPFQLFLFAYAVLGPLHYLTEISWLKEHNFFARGKYDGHFLLILGVVLTIANLVPVVRDFVPGGVIIFTAFTMSLFFLLTTSIFVRLVALIALIVFAYFFSGHNQFILFFAIFLPTIIHVYIFTIFFMLFGALKSKSTAGFINVFTLLILGLSFFFIPTFFHVTPSAYVMESYVSSFGVLHKVISSLLGMELSAISQIFFTEYGVSIMQFVAFAYTYHYLNWFSKTKIIRWHDSARKYGFLIGSIWLASVGLYAYSYTLGLAVLYFLSMTHVLLEFPLNHKTIREVLAYNKKEKVPV